VVFCTKENDLSAMLDICILLFAVCGSRGQIKQHDTRLTFAPISHVRNKSTYSPTMHDRQSLVYRSFSHDKLKHFAKVVNKLSVKRDLMVKEFVRLNIQTLGWASSTVMQICKPSES
jgi:hypothetical protein